MKSKTDREVVSLFYVDSENYLCLNTVLVFQEHTSNLDPTPSVLRSEFQVEYSKQFGYIYYLVSGGGGLSVEVRGKYHATCVAVTKRLLGLPFMEPVKIKELPPRWVDARDEPPFHNRARTMAIRKRNKTERLFSLPEEFDLLEGEDMLGWLEDNGIDDEAVWCSTCSDFFPRGNSYDHCEHIWWCDRAGMYSTPDERCGCVSYEVCRSGEE